MDEILFRFDLHLTAFQQFADLTRMAYFSDINQFCNYLNLVNVPIFSLTVFILKDYVKHMYESGLTGRTRARKIHSLKVFLKYLNEHEQFPKLAPHMVTPQYEKPLPEVLTQADMKALLLACDKGKHLNKERNKMLIYLLYASGMRISEAVKLKVSDVLMDQNMIRVIGKGNKERLIPIPTSCMIMLRQYIYPSDYYLFPTKHKNKIGPMHRSAAWRIIKIIWAKTKIKKKIHPHILRHTYASHMLQRGANIRQIQMLLGHESLQSTQQYTNVELDDIKPHYFKKHSRAI